MSPAESAFKSIECDKECGTPNQGGIAMSMPVSIQGTLKPDGTLELDQKPNLPPGQVLITVQPLTVAAQRGLADVIDEIRRGQQARGFQGRSVQEIEAGRQEGEAEYEQRMLASRSGSSAGGS
jgi:hypothetical protein